MFSTNFPRISDFFTGILLHGRVPRRQYLPSPSRLPPGRCHFIPHLLRQTMLQSRIDRLPKCELYPGPGLFVPTGKQRLAKRCRV